MVFPVTSAQYETPGFALRALKPSDKEAMLRLRDDVMAALSDPRWYFSMEEEEVEQWLAEEGAVGYFDGETLAGFAAVTPWHLRGGHAYAQVLGEPEEGTYDFHDVMVHPAYRGHRMHQRFLALAEEAVRAARGRALYATVDPDNSASWHNFEKAGYVCVVTQPAYDGRDRRYYKRSLADG